MENEKGMCDICGCHKDGRYRWARLVLAVLLGLFIFLAGIQIGEMRSEVGGYQGRMMRWDMDGGNMMWNGQEGTTTIMVAPPTTQTTPTAPATTAATKSTAAPTTGATTPTTR